MQGSVDATLAQGNFDFAFKVKEFNMMDGKLGQIDKSIHDISAKSKKTVIAAAATGLAEWALTFIFTVQKALATTAGLANPFALGAGAASAAMGNWRDVQQKVSEFARFEVAMADMCDSIETIHDQISKNKDNLSALSNIGAIIKDFINSFENKAFKKQLDKDTADVFLTKFEKYSSPFDMGKLNEAQTLLASSLELFCSVIFDGMTVVAAGAFQHYCAQVTADIGNMISMMGGMNSIGRDYTMKSKEIISLYGVCAENNELAGVISNTMDSGMEAQRSTPSF